MSAERRPEASVAADDAAVRRRFAKNLGRRMRERGLTAERLSERSEIDADRLAEILRAGARPARYGEIVLLCGALGVDADQLFEGISWSPPSEGGRGFTVTEGRTDG